MVLPVRIRVRDSETRIRWSEWFITAAGKDKGLVVQMPQNITYAAFGLCPLIFGLGLRFFGSDSDSDSDSVRFGPVRFGLVLG